MSVSRRAARRDANEGAIIKALREAGAVVVQLSGEGIPDLLVGVCSSTYLIEVKASDGALTKPQQEFHRKWIGSPIYIVRTPEEALNILKGNI